MHRRSDKLARALATGALVLVAPLLASCGFDYATDKIYTPAPGVNHRDGTVDVLNAVIVSSGEGHGTFIATFANNSATETDRLVALEPGAEDGFEAEVFDALEIAPRGAVNLADVDGENLGIPVTGDFAAGEFVTVVVSFGTGEAAELEIPVVAARGAFEGLDVATTGEKTVTDEPGAH